MGTRDTTSQSKDALRSSYKGLCFANFIFFEIPVQKPDDEGSDPLKLFIDYLKELRNIYVDSDERRSCFGSAAFLRILHHNLDT